MCMLWPGQPSDLISELEDAVLARLSNRIKETRISNIVEGQACPALFYLTCTLKEKVISTL